MFDREKPKHCNNIIKNIQLDSNKYMFWTCIEIVISAWSSKTRCDGILWELKALKGSPNTYYVCLHISMEWPGNFFWKLSLQSIISIKIVGLDMSENLHQLICMGHLNLTHKIIVYIHLVQSQVQNKNWTRVLFFTSKS